MTWISDETVERLREAAEWPDLGGTRYDALERIDRGGMGIIYRAYERDLDREVAIKVLATGCGEAALERMKREARILVAFAHAHGVVHRDLKPENVMIGAFGEVLVMDWGVAKLLDGGGIEPAAARGAAQPGTRAGTVLGTPGYMSPEQARGETEIGPPSDIYSLGAILHFLLTGAPPETPPRFPREVPKPLRSICRKALAGSPRERYASAVDLSADVTRYRESRPVAAHREGIAETAARLYRRYRIAILLVASYLVVRVVMLFVFRT